MVLRLVEVSVRLLDDYVGSLCKCIEGVKSKVIGR